MHDDEHEIWTCEHSGGWYYVEGVSRNAGWFCFELDDRHMVVCELVGLGFSTAEIDRALSETAR